MVLTFLGSVVAGNQSSSEDNGPMGIICQSRGIENFPKFNADEETGTAWMDSVYAL